MDSGTEGGEAEIMKDTASIKNYMINKAGYTDGTNLETYVDQGGQHNEYFWGRRF